MSSLKQDDEYEEGGRLEKLKNNNNEKLICFLQVRMKYPMHLILILVNFFLQKRKKKKGSGLFRKMQS